jgi:hypothetical protein
MSKTTSILILAEPSLKVSALDSFEIIAQNLWLLWNIYWQGIRNSAHFFISMSEVAS